MWNHQESNVFAEKHMTGAADSLVHITLADLNIMRRKVAKKVMVFEVFLTGCCPKCGMTVDDDLETIPCADCGRSYHFTNYCVEADVERLGDGERFRCTLCRMNYWPRVLRQQQRATNTNQSNFQDYESVSRGPKKPVGPKLLAEKTPTCCLCTEPHDERQYWECDKCDSRLHPGCIGRDPDETPADSSTAFWCEACLTAVVKVWPVDNCKEFIKSGGLSDDEGYIIDASVVLSLMHAGYSRCWLIIHAQGTKSQTRWLQRHEAFLRCRNLPYSRYYGANVFSGDAQIILRRNLDRIFLKKKYPEEIYSKHHIIDGIENKEFANLFNEEFGLAECYVSKVLQKEAMIAILQMHSAVGYQEADSRLKEAESNSNRAMLAGLL